MRKRLVMAVVAMSLLFGVLPVAARLSPADAQTDLEQARQEVAAATERLEALLADLDATQQRGDEHAQRYWQVQSEVERIGLDIAANEAVALQLTERIAGLRNEVRVIAVDQYVSSSEHVGVADHTNEADRAAARALARLVVGTDNEAIDDLAAAEAEQETLVAALEGQRTEQLRALDEVEQTQAEISDELRRLSALQDDVAGELADLETALAGLERAEAERQAAEAERARIAEERARAEAAAAEAAQRARAVPTVVPAPTPTEVPTPQPSEPEPEPTVPNPQPGEPFPTPEGAEPEPTVPNPQPGEPFPTPEGAEPEPTVPNPQPSEPFPTPEGAEPESTPVPNPQPSVPTAPSGGGIVCPLAGPFTHTDDFNSPRAVGGVHRANDLISDAGTPVLAAASGTLEHKESSVGGLSAHLKGDNGDYYFYTHLSGYENVGAGHVAAGTIIGYVGETGNAPIPHLHFEIHSGGYGNYTNPYGPVRAACF